MSCLCASDCCARVEFKEASNLETTIVRIILFEKILEKGTVGRSEYFCHSFILLGKEAPSWQQIATKDASTKIYWTYWDSLELMA